MEQKNENTITIDTTNLENYRVGLEDKLYGIDNTIKTQLLEQLDRILNKLKDYNSKEIIKEDSLNIDFRLRELNRYINKLNTDEKLTNSLVFGVIKSVIEDFRKEYYNTIGIDISEEKEEDVSVNKVRYFDKYLSDKGYINHFVLFLAVCESISIFEGDINNVPKAENNHHNLCKHYYDLLNLGNKTQEQRKVYFEEDEKHSKSKSGSSEDYSSAIEEMGEVIVAQTNSRSSSPVNGF